MLWAVGDIQGCFDSFSALLGRIDFAPEGGDRLWLAGDLVNRGPRSLDVLRWVAELDDEHPGCLEVVLGNHDLHLLACAAGVVEARKKDTFQPVLALPKGERERHVHALRRRPLVVVEGETLMVHAGLWPGWGFEQARAYAEEVQAVLGGEAWGELLAAWRLGREERPASWASRWRDDLVGEERLVTLLEVFTRMRCLDPRGRLIMDYAGPPLMAPLGSRPWYADRDGVEGSIVFGHWAAHGYDRGPGWIALDSGCVWGESLTACCLDDGTVVQQAALE